MHRLIAAFAALVDRLGLGGVRVYRLESAGWTLAVERRGAVTALAGRRGRDGASWALAVAEDGTLAGSDLRGRPVETTAES
jgi:hypothetical protein